jgi:hypothetical protein
MNWTAILAWLTSTFGPALGQILLGLLQKQHQAGNAAVRALLAKPQLDLSGLKGVLVGIIQTEGPALLQLLIDAINNAGTTTAAAGS